ncbi:RAD59 [Candida pseudojiufengensis]|uniref:RAD59 n=1 Tax=Candida pseudojiufengensis TaxID=497109 RepID=UPI002224BECF|nr:RAD59 [Candida pseudojiufengensis]KAI5965549.1 RAD59 [Candida pseudojiufengensis]
MKINSAHKNLIHYGAELMTLYDSKYTENEGETVPSTPSFFVNLENFESSLEFESNHLNLSPWLIGKIGVLQKRIDDIQHSNHSRRFSDDRLSQSQLFNLTNEIFGFNGWSTSIEESIVIEKPTKIEKVWGDKEENDNDITLNASEVNPDEKIHESGVNHAIEVERDESNEAGGNEEKSNGTGNIEVIKHSYSAESICIIKLYLKDGTVRKGFGKGQAINLPNRNSCFAKCKKEAVTNAIKNAILSLRDLYFEYETAQLNVEDLGF